MLQTIMDTIKVSEETIFGSVSKQAAEISQTDPLLKRLMEEVVLSRQNLWEVLAARISRKLGVGAIDESEIYQMFLQTFLKDESMRDKILRDISAIKYRDPACSSYIDPIMYFKGFHAITTHRVSHWLWGRGKIHSALYLQSLASDVFAVDIHPAARFGGGILLDHATSFVAGETSVVEDNVSILHEVTLGGTGNEVGDRHPKVRSGVLIGAGAKLIGNIIIGLDHIHDTPYLPNDIFDGLLGRVRDDREHTHPLDRRMRDLDAFDIDLSPHEGRRYADQHTYGILGKGRNDIFFRLHNQILSTFTRHR